MGVYSIHYPSGKKFSLEGQLHVGRMENAVPGLDIATIIPTHGAATLLDPRAKVYDENGILVFLGCSTAALERAMDSKK